MRILLLHDKGTATGGAELLVVALREGLRARGHEVRLLSSSASPVQGAPLLADDVCFGTNSRLQVLTQTANPSAWRVVRRVLRDFRPDVVHVRLFLWQLSPLILPLLRPFPALYQTSMYKAICPKGTRVLPDGSPCREAPGRACLGNRCLTPQSWAVLMLQAALWRRWRGSFDTVVALSERMRGELEAHGVGPVEVVHNGVPVRPPRPPLAGAPTAAYAGRLVPEKGVALLLRAFAATAGRLPEARLAIAGQGPERPHLEALAAELGVTERVTFLGHLPREELERRLDGSWAQVVPSRWEEPFGNVSTEAMMRGTAVIASAVGGQPEIVKDGETGLLVPPDDERALEAALVAVLGDRDRAERMGAAGRRVALDCFSEARCLDRFEAIYRRLVERYATRPPSGERDHEVGQPTGALLP